MTPGLSDAQRTAIHDLALGARDLLMREAKEVLEGTYGLYADGRMEPPNRLPLGAGIRPLYDRLAAFIDDQARAGLSRAEAVARLTKEIAFTHLNRLAAFKMMEARRLIRGTVDKYTDSNGFKHYLVDDPDALALHTRGEVDAAYRAFLLWQCAQVARELDVLFDPEALPGLIFPRPRALQRLVAMLNAEALAEAWAADETIGWIYQFFNEEEKAEVFTALRTKKRRFRRQDIPAATQLFTPNWIVRYLVQNTLGRLWVQMHPDTRLLGTPLLGYLVPLKGDVPPEPLRPVREIALLDPACGTMHFGLVAFDLLAAMYREELERAGEPGWPKPPSVTDDADIPAAILAHNLYGIDIDLRAVQLSALALYLKAKSLNPKAAITESHLACADVLPANGARLGEFLKASRFRPGLERLVRGLWDRLKEASYVGSLLRLEVATEDLVSHVLAEESKQPLFSGLMASGGEEERAEYVHVLADQVVQALYEFTKALPDDGIGYRFFTGETRKGLRLLEIMSRRYDVVVTNPPYSAKRNLNERLADYLDTYPEGKRDLYAAFIQRCGEFLEEGGRLGIITQQSFLFLSSYEKLRAWLRERAAVETLAHTGARAFAEIGGEVVNTTAYTLRRDEDTVRRENAVGTYIRLVHAPEGDGKRLAFERALREGCDTYRVAQRRFDAIPGSPWVYWVSDDIRRLFETLPKLGDVAEPKNGLTTGDNQRFLRYWWEVTRQRTAWSCHDRDEALASHRRWFPCMKGGAFQRWYGNQEHVINWHGDGKELVAFERSFVRNSTYYFREGITWNAISSKGFCPRLMPPGFIFETKGSAAIPILSSALQLLGVLSSQSFSKLYEILAPTIDFHEGYLANVPLPPTGSTVEKLAADAVHCCQTDTANDESTFDFISPPTGLAAHCTRADVVGRLGQIQQTLDAYMENAYGLDSVGRVYQAVPLDNDGGAELAVQNSDHDSSEQQANKLGTSWLSYAVGVILSRFRPGDASPAPPHGVRPLGRAIFRRDDFSIGSLPAPSEEEFDALVGPPKAFAYVDADGGRHVFSREVEAALRDLALDDGIAVLDEGHPRDLPALVARALDLMLGADGAREVIATAAGGDLRRYLERDYLTKEHVRRYRKRPVYWPLQSAKRSYGFVIFHQRFGRDTLYRLQRDYLDPKVNAVRLELTDLQARLTGLSGRAARRAEREIARLAELLDELVQFGETMARLARDGYEPETNWIDDGVILRLAPIWELIPGWRAEPKKYWARLEAGDYDWSHIAMRYWPERVRAACRANKSFAIAHGHEEWYEGE